MELFVNLNTTTEIYDNNCSPDFECYLGFEICYAFSKLDYRISTLEMCLIPTYSIGDIDSFIADAGIIFVIVILSFSLSIIHHFDVIMTEEEFEEFKKMSMEEFKKSKWFKMIEIDFIDKCKKAGLK
jgi:hypothetical protein